MKMNKGLLCGMFAGSVLWGAFASPSGTLRPTVWADIPDVSPLRVGNTYYMTSTSNHFTPGVPMLSSKDLVHWKTIGYCYDTLANEDDNNLANGKCDYAGGAWASSLRYNEADGCFYVSTFDNHHKRTYIFRAKNPAGPWERRTINRLVYDHSLWIEDGKFYFIATDRTVSPCRVLLHRIKPDFSDVEPDPVELCKPGVFIPGHAYAEGCQLLKRNGWYYLVNIAWPRRRCRLVTVHRSRTLEGPYAEARIAFEREGIAQGSFIEKPDGTWVAVLFADRGGVGRVPFVLPMTWQDDWPVVEAKDIYHGDFSKVPDCVTADEFDGAKPALAWQINHNPDNAHWRLANGCLEITTSRADGNLDWVRNHFTQRTFGPTCEAVTKVDGTRMKVGDKAGLSLYELRWGCVSLVRTAAGYEVVMNHNGVCPPGVNARAGEVARAPIGTNAVVWLKAECDYRRLPDENYRINPPGVDEGRFFHSPDGKTWEALGPAMKLPFTTKHFTGFRFGLYNWATKEAGGTAAFDFFRPGVPAERPREIGLGWKDGWVERWAESVPGLEVRDSRKVLPNGLERITRRWTWTGKEPLEKVTLSVRVPVNGDPKKLKPFIPGVLLYGNPSNAGRTDGRVAVYAGEAGEFAQFEDHRLPMPFVCLEDTATGDFTAVHTVPSSVRGAVRDDLWWSAGVEAREGGADIVLMSGPVGYNRKRSVVKARQREAMTYDETYLTLQPGQVVEKTYYVQKGKATAESFGFQQALDACLDLYRPYDAQRFPTIAEIAKVKRDFALTRWIEEPKFKACGFDMYDPRRRREIVMGWCGCAATCGYALPVLDFDKEDWAKAQRSLDFLAESSMDHVLPNGIFRVKISMGDGIHRKGDPVSCGQALYSFAKAIRFAEGDPQRRLDTTKWRAFVRKVVENLSADILRPDWPEPRSTNVGFLVAPLVVASELFNDPKALAAAEKIAEALARKYIGYDAVYWGGTLDASCEDKEGCYAAFQGFVELLRHALRAKDTAAEKRWAPRARHAMDMMLTYTMVWDSTYPPGRLSDHAFKSTGWTVVSAQNQHLDVFGVLTTPEVWWMGDYLKDERLKKLALVMYRSCLQLTDDAGSQGEQIQHTNFAQQGDMSDVCKLRGGYSESWTVFWITAHFLNAAAEFRELGAF